MCDNEAVNERSAEPEIRGGDKPADYIKSPPTWPLRADAIEAEDDLHVDDES